MSESSNEKLNLRSDSVAERKHKLARGGLALLLAGTVLTGAGCSGDKVSATAPEVSPSTTTESVAEPTETAEDYVDSMEVYKEMSVDEFEALPREERLQYAQFLKDITEHRGIYENIYGEGRPGEDYGIDYQEASLDDTNDTILAGYLYKLQISFLQPGGMENNKMLLNQDNAQKILSYAFYDVGEGLITSKYKIQKEQIVSTENIIYINNEFTSTVESKTKQGILTDRINGDNYNVKYRDIETSTEGQKMYMRFVFEEFSDYKNQNSGTWLLESDGYNLDSLNSNSSIK